MSIEEDNVAILRQAYERWNETGGGSAEHWLGIVADDIDFRSLGGGQQGGLEFTCPGEGCAGLAAYFEALAQQYEILGYRFDDAIAQGDRVVMVGAVSMRNRTTGKQCETPKVDIARMKDGKIIEFTEYYDTAKVMATAQQD